MLAVNELAVRLPAGGREVVLTGPMSFSVEAGEIFGIVGESGSGKTMAALALMRLLPHNARLSGTAILNGRDLVTMRESEIRAVRGAEMGMIFQEPVAALNPAFTIEAQLKAAIRAHHSVSARAARARAAELLRLVGIPDPNARLAYYPHQLSGGQCQRVMIAMAMAAGANLLIADEATTSLDVTIQDEIVRLLERLARETGIAVLFISHDLALVAKLCHRVAVVYAGQIVEIGDTRTLLNRPTHPYTKGLLRCVQSLDQIGVIRRGIPGAPPLPGTWPAGCRFQARCEFGTEGCEVPQALLAMDTGHEARCCRAGKLLERAAR